MLAVAGKKLNKAEKLKLSFLFLETFFFFCLTSGLFTAWAQETHIEGGVSKENSGVGGHLWGTAEFIQTPEQWSRTGVRWHRYSSVSPPSHFTAAFFFSCIDFYLFIFFSLNRYRNMGNLLKVLTCTDLEQEPNFFLDFESEFLF